MIKKYIINQKKLKIMKKILSVLLIASVGGLVSLGIYKLTNKQQTQQPIRTSVQQEVPPIHLVNQISGSGGPGLDFTTAAKKTVHAVVHIETEFRQKNSMYDYFFNLRNFFGGIPNSPQQRTMLIKASGSGVIISSDGYIVTNNHVVQQADKITVTLNDKRSYKAKIIGTDPSTDLALIKIDEKNLPYLVYGNSDDVKVGQWVLAVGNPFNLTSTVTAGIVSAKARNINILGNSTGNNTPIESFIQTDAAVNPGNSGGALVDTEGKLIGINAAIASGTGYYEGYSFAIPVNIVKKVMDDLLQYGEVQRGYMGISIRNIDSDFAKENDIDKIEGVYVASVMDDGSAKKAGMKKGDIITKIDNKEINSTSELLGTVGQYRPGDKISVTIKRNNREKNFKIILKNRDGNTSIVKNDAIIILGATIEPAPADELNKLGLKNGVIVTKLNPGKLRSNGIRKGFIITKINSKKMRTTDDVKNALEYKKGGVLIEGIYTNGTKAYYGMGL